MAITIDYTTRIISVEKVDMTLVQSTPFEIYELDINDFRLTLKDIEEINEEIKKSLYKRYAR